MKTGQPLISTVVPSGVLGQLSSIFNIPSSSKSLDKVVVVKWTKNLPAPLNLSSDLNCKSCSFKWVNVLFTLSSK